MPGQFWTQRLHFGPSARFAHAMAYDAARQRVLLFGGQGSAGDLGDTWSWDGSFWTQVADVGPGARRGHAMAYDAARRQVVLFGGVQGAACLSDTWVWDGSAWTQVAETGPSARAFHRMAGDDLRSVVVLFGGDADGDLSDTWEWDGQAWTQREEAGPSARRGHAMTLDLASMRVVVFGGAAGATVLDDTWDWNGTSWRQVAEFGAPSSVDASITYAGRSCLLFGGAAATADGEAGRPSTWEWDTHFWTEVQHFGPPGRCGHATAMDLDRRKVVLFGGTRLSRSLDAAALLGDTWELPGREYLLASLSVSPASVYPGDHFQITVTLREASSAEFVVRLSSAANDAPAAIGVPATVTIPAGQLSAIVDAALPPDATTSTYAITAAGGGANYTQRLDVIWAPAGTLRIVAVLPNPVGDELQDEAVHIRNLSANSVQLAGWSINRGGGNPVQWVLDAADGVVEPGQSVVVTRRGRPLALPNAGGDVILANPEGFVKDAQRYGPAAPGQLITFA